MKTATIQDLAEQCHKIVKSDRYILTVISGDTGEGKSCIAAQIAKAISACNQLPFRYQDNMTYLRSELMEWVDGKGEKKEGQKPEGTVIIADELISMFFKRNFYDEGQIQGIELLNKCRDRHLVIIGNVPSFWDLDSAMYGHITFWIHVETRGLCHVFMKDRNPFETDKWHRKENLKLWAKYKSPWKCRGYLFSMKFKDWSPQDKQAYYDVRNKKRVGTEGQGKEKYRKIKDQRDRLIRYCYEKRTGNKKEIAIVAGVDPTHVVRVTADLELKDEK